MIRRSAAGLAAAWLVGLALGLLDAFLEPLRKRHAALADLLLLPAAFRGWCSGRPRWGRRPWP